MLNVQLDTELDFHKLSGLRVDKHMHILITGYVYV